MGKKQFRCGQCQNTSLKWLGKCPNCNSWNSYTEEIINKPKSARQDKQTLFNREDGKENSPVPVNEIIPSNQARLKVGLSEFDRILGGGLVPGSFLLLGGDPGIGKSTILLQVSNLLAEQKQKILYVTGEESLDQIKLRADRLDINEDNLFIMAETRLDKIKEQALRLAPSALIIDSIQTVYSSSIESTPGTVSQIRECAGELMVFAKSTGVSTFVIGHVTKEGAVAGPKILEHLVDTVLYFEGSGDNQYRILRVIKNRFGSCNEIGVFDMKETGLKEVHNPSEYFLSQRHEGVAGSSVIVSLEGSKPLLIEFQALVSSSNFGHARRNSLGVELPRLNMLIAIIEKVMGYSLSGEDIFANVVGGIKVNDPASDLGIIAAIVSSYLNKIVDAHTILLGEVGLTGEIRSANQLDIRVNEAIKLGFKTIVLPKKAQKSISKNKKVDIYFVAKLEEALDIIFDNS